MKILSVVEKHLNEKQKKRYISIILERIVEDLIYEGRTKGQEDLSIDIQSNICLIEQVFLPLGRQSPLEKIYTAEEEELLDLLFHNSSENLF